MRHTFPGRVYFLDPRCETCILEGKSYQIYSVIETGRQYGMQLMDRVLADLHRGGTVTFEEAARRAIDRENFQRLVKGF